MSDFWSKTENLQAYAKKRREKYAKDPEYRRRELARQRKLYEEKTGKVWTNPARDAIQSIRQDARYTPAEISVLLNRRGDYVARMISKGLWPSPDDGVSYSWAETGQMLAVFAEHLENVSTYRLDHTETKRALFAALNKGGPV